MYCLISSVIDADDEDDEDDECLKYCSIQVLAVGLTGGEDCCSDLRLRYRNYRVDIFDRNDILHVKEEDDRERQLQ